MDEIDTSMRQAQADHLWDTWMMAATAILYCWNPIVLAILVLVNDGILPSWVAIAICSICGLISIPNVLLATWVTYEHLMEPRRIRGKKDSKRKLRRLLSGMEQARERALQSIVTLAKGNVPYRTKALAFPRPQGITLDTASDRQFEEIEHLTAIDREIATLETRIAHN